MKLNYSLAIFAFTLTVASLNTSAAPLADRHASRGLNCQMCHTTMPPKTVQQKTCLQCHGGSYAELAKKTDKNDINPHDTHVENAECSQCHSGHKKPRLLCDECHEFKDIKVP